MIEMRNIAGLICPVIVCDACDQPITDAVNAAVEGEWTTHGRTGWESGSLRFVHLGPGPHATPCYSRNRPWRPLREFLAQLVNNYESSPWRELAEESAR